MSSATARAEPVSADDPGEAMHALMRDLYPICRSITGDGFRRTLRLLQERIPLTIHEVPSGTAVFDWEVPREWNVRDACIKNSAGERVVDFQANNLHLLNYSVPVHARMRLDALKEHLYTLPDHPDWIPYRTSYYAERWGFCLSHRQLQSMPDDDYEVRIDTALQDGSLTYGEYHHRGESDHEVLISCHACHPSLCNDNLSGVVLAAALAAQIAARQTRYSYRFLFIPGTIGSITWLALHEEEAQRIKHGLVLTCVGDPGPVTYKRSRRGDAEIDRAVAHVLRHAGHAHTLQDFSPYGYDERQYCSPGFNLPVGCLMRTPHGRFPQYHTSADNLEFVRPEALADSLAVCDRVVDVLEHNWAYLNTNPKCEPRLGKRGLYRSIGGVQDEDLDETAILWVLNQSDGDHSLLDIAERAGMPFASIRRAADALRRCDLLVPA